jgi:hypothetical protein
MRAAIVFACLAVSACAADPHALTYTKKSDPIWPLNEGMWSATANDLTTAPTLPAGQQVMPARQPPSPTAGKQ